MSGKHLPGRPPPSQRGYGRRHREIRKAWEPRVRAGLVDCTAELCMIERDGGTRRIGGNDAWDLGHDETDRRKYKGPQHPECNRGQARRAPVNTPPSISPSAPFDESAWL